MNIGGRAGRWERMDAVEEMIQTAYAMKGWTLDTGMDKTLVRVYQRRER
jgi:hypothetical protein